MSTGTAERGTRDKPIEFAEGQRPPLGREAYDHVHIGGRCVHNVWPTCDFKPAGVICTSCQLARMLESGVLASSVDAGHSDCEAHKPGDCACGCVYSRYQACRECLRKGTDLDDDGQCVNRKECADAIVARHRQLAADRQKRAAAAPTKQRSGGGGGKRPCTCGCGEMTGGGMYRPGHDARHVSRLVREVKAGEISVEDARKQIAHSDKLVAKFDKAVS